MNEAKQIWNETSLLAIHVTMAEGRLSRGNICCTLGCMMTSSKIKGIPASTKNVDSTVSASSLVLPSLSQIEHKEAIQFPRTVAHLHNHSGFITYK